MSNLSFRLMAFTLKIRDYIMDPQKAIKPIIQEGDYILDYGCGPGSYTIFAAKLVGDKGRVYAVDIHPIAIKMVNNKAQKENLKNIEAIQSDCDTKLPDEHIDKVLLFDLLHDLSNPNEVLKELHRVLKNNGTLFISDHHLKKDKLIEKVVDGKIFKFKNEENKIFSFIKT